MHIKTPQKVNQEINKGGVFLIVLVALFIRILISYQMEIISKDGVIYLSLAQYIKEGNLSLVLAHRFHPLYPLTIALLSYLIGSLELSGKIISIISGTSLVIIAYWIIRPFLYPRQIYLTLLLIALHPRLVSYSSDVLSDPLYFFLFMIGLFFIFRVVFMRSLFSAFLTGIFCGISYLVRPEGLLLAIFVFISICYILFIKHINIKKALYIGFIAFLGFMLTGGPYIYYLKQSTGHIILTKKKTLSQMVEGKKD